MAKHKRICSICGKTIRNDHNYITNLDTGEVFHKKCYKNEYGNIPKNIKHINEDQKVDLKQLNKAKKRKFPKKTTSNDDICALCGKKLRSNSRYLIDQDSGAKFHQKCYKDNYGSLAGIPEISKAEANPVAAIVMMAVQIVLPIIMQQGKEGLQKWNAMSVKERKDFLKKISKDKKLLAAATVATAGMGTGSMITIQLALKNEKIRKAIAEMDIGEMQEVAKKVDKEQVAAIAKEGMKLTKASAKKPISPSLKVKSNPKNPMKDTDGMDNEEYMAYLTGYAKEHDAILKWPAKEFYGYASIEYKGYNIDLSAAEAGEPKQMESFIRLLPKVVTVAEELLAWENKDMFYSTISNYTKDVFGDAKGKNIAWSGVVDILKAKGIDVHSNPSMSKIEEEIVDMWDEGDNTFHEIVKMTNQKRAFVTKTLNKHRPGWDKENIGHNNPKRYFKYQSGEIPKIGDIIQVKYMTTRGGPVSYQAKVIEISDDPGAVSRKGEQFQRVIVKPTHKAFGIGPRGYTYDITTAEFSIYNTTHDYQTGADIIPAKLQSRLEKSNPKSKSFSEDERDIIHMYYDEGWTIPNIAGAYDLSEAEVTKILKDAYISPTISPLKSIEGEKLRFFIPKKSLDIILEQLKISKTEDNRRNILELLQGTGYIELDYAFGTPEDIFLPYFWDDDKPIPKSMPSQSKNTYAVEIDIYQGVDAFLDQIDKLKTKRNREYLKHALWDDINSMIEADLDDIDLIKSRLEDGGRSYEFFRYLPGKVTNITLRPGTKVTVAYGSGIASGKSAIVVSPEDAPFWKNIPGMYKAPSSNEVPIQFDNGEYAYMFKSRLIPVEHNPLRRPRWKRGSKLQSIAFEKDKWTKREAENWLKKYHKKIPEVDVWKNYYRYRQEDPEEFIEDNYATIPFGKDTGIYGIIAEPESNPTSQKAKSKIKRFAREIEKGLANPRELNEDYIKTGKYYLKIQNTKVIDASPERLILKLPRRMTKKIAKQMEKALYDDLGVNMWISKDDDDWLITTEGGKDYYFNVLNELQLQGIPNKPMSNPTLIQGKYAYLPVIDPKGAGIGIAIEGESGYYKTDLPHYEKYEDADEHADILNEKLGLEKKDALKIVASTFRGNPKIKPKKGDWLIILGTDWDKPYYNFQIMGTGYIVDESSKYGANLVYKSLGTAVEYALKHKKKSARVFLSPEWEDIHIPIQANPTKEQARKTARKHRAKGKRARVMRVGKDEYAAFIDGDRMIKPKKKGVVPKKKRPKKKKDVVPTKSELKKAYKMGRSAFQKGKKSAPAQDEEVMDWLEGKKAEKIYDLLGEWTKGWHDANIEAPVVPKKKVTVKKEIPTEEAIEEAIAFKPEEGIFPEPKEKIQHLIDQEYVFYNDPAHGWLRVKLKDLEESGVAPSITNSSYMDKTYAYLEEDYDAGQYLTAIGLEPGSMERNEFLDKLNIKYSERSHVRSKDPYEYSPVVPKKLPKKKKDVVPKQLELQEGDLVTYTNKDGDKIGEGLVYDVRTIGDGRYRYDINFIDYHKEKGDSTHIYSDDPGLRLLNRPSDPDAAVQLWYSRWEPGEAEEEIEVIPEEAEEEISEAALADLITSGLQGLLED